MLKRLTVAVAALFVLASSAFAAGTVPGFALTPQFNSLGQLATGCKLYIVQAGTVSTPQNAYQDTALTILHPNPMTCDSTGRLPQWFVADGNIKLRLTDRNGVSLFVQDNLLVIGPSGGGGGGGGTVDPTTILATGDHKMRYGTGPLSGFVRCNGRTIGSATSGGTERANADTSSLFTYLWGADPNLAVSGGRGASAAADFSANKTITLPDCRGRGIAGLDDMGNSAAGRLTASYFGTLATVLGAVGGAESYTLIQANLPNVSLSAASLTGTIDTTGLHRGAAGTYGAGVGGTNVWQNLDITTTGISKPVTFGGSIPLGGSSTAHNLVQPTILMTIYIKL